MRSTILVPVLLCVASAAAAQQTTTAGSQPPVIGRWNITVNAGPRVAFPSWLEIQQSGFTSLVGRFVGRIGSARPIGRVEWSAADSTFRFTIPPEWVRDPRDLRVEGRLVGDSLVGTMGPPVGLNVGSPAATVPFVGRRAPSLRRPMPAAWSAPRPLFNGKDLSGWTPSPFGRNYWAVRDGTLVTTAAEGSNLLTVEKFQDFKLHVEYRLPKGGDTGVFLRGRYEVQAQQDTTTDWTSTITTGAIYSTLVPNENASLGPDRWQSMDITLVGRRVTVVVNGKTVIADQVIPGLSGSALDADESAPGPIMLQGEEVTPVEFRNITIRVPRGAGRSEGSAPSSQALGCAAGDSAAAVALVRTRLAEWVRQTNGGDRAGANEVWAPAMVGWFPRASVFSDSAAYAVARAAGVAQTPLARATVSLVIEDVVVSGPVVVVHDVWTEGREFGSPEKAVQRVIRGSELWRCQPDGRWRIVRYVSAPEPWTVVNEQRK
jgi:ketosteroid isomerase-like protein